MNKPSLDPRIGSLANGQFYAYADGYDKPETVGTLQQVEQALGIAGRLSDMASKTYDVVMRFAYPAWDEVDGIPYPGITARSKSEAIKLARSMAVRDGHAIGGRGRYTFKATEI